MFIQLASTTPYLSGQFKINLDLQWSDGECSTKDASSGTLSPALESFLTRETPFMNYSIEENMKLVYDSLGDRFFDDVPVRSPEKILFSEKWTDTVDHTYRSGMRRLSYSNTGKQFGLLCPVWTDDITELLAADIRFTIRAFGSSMPTAVTTVKLSKAVRDKIEEYGRDVSKDLINLNLDRNEVFVNGLHVPTATTVTKDVSYVLNSLFDREKTLIETDSILSQLLTGNHIVAKQMLNLFFRFNITDIMPAYLASDMLYHQWSVECTIVSDGKEIPYKDLYTNYSFIPAKRSSPVGAIYDDTVNALDYMLDNKCIDTIFDNKVTQPIFHWALSENPSEIFNMYSGLSLVTIDNKGNRTYSRMPSGSPDPFMKEYKEEYDNLGWAKIRDLRGVNNKRHIIESMVDLSKDFTEFAVTPGKVQWINSMKLDYPIDAHDTYMYVNIILCNDVHDIYDIITPHDSSYSTDRPYIIRHDSDDLVVSIVVNPDSEQCSKTCILNSIINKSFSGNFTGMANIIASKIEKIFEGYTYPWEVVFTKSLTAVKAPSPSYDTEEIEYYRSDYNKNTKIYRHFGNLNPMFTDGDKLFNECCWVTTIDSGFLNTTEGKRYSDFLSTCFPQEYPSIGYYPIESERFTLDAPERYPSYTEVTWCNDSRFWALPEKIEISVILPSSQLVDSVTVSNILSYHFQNRGVSPLAFDSCIRNSYKHSTDFDYVSESDISEMIYNITYSLK